MKVFHLFAGLLNFNGPYRDQSLLANAEEEEEYEEEEDEDKGDKEEKSQEEERAVTVHASSSAEEHIIYLPPALHEGNMIVGLATEKYVSNEK